MLDSRQTLNTNNQPLSINPQFDQISKKKPSNFVIADLNVDPPDSDGEDCALLPPPRPICQEKSSSLLCKETDNNNTAEVGGDGTSSSKTTLNNNKLGKYKSRIKSELVDCGGSDHVDPDQQGGPSSREDKVTSLKTGLIHVSRKMPKNAHAHFILGLMYQRLGQPQKAVLAYEKAEEILLRTEEEIGRPELLLAVQIHHAQCLLLGSTGDYNSDKNLETDELEEIISKLKESVEADIRQVAVWNTLGLILLKTGRLESAISVLSSLLTVGSEDLDALANLGIAYLRSGNLELSTKCFEDLILKDQNHPAAIMNYTVLLLCKYGSVFAGVGANSGEGACTHQLEAANVAMECLTKAVQADPKSAHLWVNLANAYSLAGEHRNSGKCLEKAVELEPSCMSSRYAVALHRIKDAEISQDPNGQLCWAGNEMASILKDGDHAIVEPRIVWTGLAMVHRAQHEIASSFEVGQKDLPEVEERALYTLKKAIEENPDDAVQWHQLGLHCLCTLQYKMSQMYLKAAIARSRDCCYAWSNLGISLQLSEDPSQAEEVYRRALSLATPGQAHTTFSNLGNLYRQQKRFDRAKAMIAKSLELNPGYAPAHNNLGLVFVAEGRWEDANNCFEKALKSDPLLDASKSNIMKTSAMCRVHAALSSSLLGE